jgi:hypothetical protein
MPIVLRKSGNSEPYVKPTLSTVTKLIQHGILKSYNKSYGYCDEADDVGTGMFHWKGSLFKIEYMSGCFYPFLLQIDMGKFGIEGTWFEPKPDMWEDRNFPDFEKYAEGRKAYFKNNKWYMVPDYSYWNKKPIMSKDEAKELID